jgi:hypothetical protein
MSASLSPVCSRVRSLIEQQMASKRLVLAFSDSDTDMDSDDDDDDWW